MVQLFFIFSDSFKHISHNVVQDCVVWCNVVRPCVVRGNVVQDCVIWCNVVRPSVVQGNVVRRNVVQCNVVQPTVNVSLYLVFKRDLGFEQKY